LAQGTALRSRCTATADAPMLDCRCFARRINAPAHRLEH